jgi:hypothetical protein
MLLRTESRNSGAISADDFERRVGAATGHGRPLPAGPELEQEPVNNSEQFDATLSHFATEPVGAGAGVGAAGRGGVPAGPAAPPAGDGGVFFKTCICTVYGRMETNPLALGGGGCRSAVAGQRGPPAYECGRPCRGSACGRGCRRWRSLQAATRHIPGDADRCGGAAARARTAWRCAVAAAGSGATTALRRSGPQERRRVY